MRQHSTGQRGSQPWIAGVILCAICATSADAVQTAFPFDRYQVILNRKPFGDVPPPPPPPPKPVIEKPVVPGPGSYMKKLRLCAMREMGGEGGPLRIGLVDDNIKPPRSYFLYVGDMMDGIEIVEASYNDKKALVKRGDEEYWLDMNSARTAPPPAVAGAEGGGSRTTIASAIAARAKAKATPKKRRSYAERLRERRKEEELRRQVVAEEKAKLTKEELREFFRQQQMEIIRSGQPPLPIPLTKEMDDQLVAEGVLPPQE